MTEIHKPTDCGLAITYPLSFWSFWWSFNKPGGPQFPRHHAENLNLPPDASVREIWNTFKPCAAQIKEGVRQIQRRGVTVKLNATFADVKKLFHTCKVVTVFSHYPFEYINATDIKNPQELIDILNSFLSYVPASPSPQDAYRAAVARAWKRYTESTDIQPIRLEDALSICFNKLIKKDELAVFNTPSLVKQQEPSERLRLEEGENTLFRFSRLDFEVAFPDHIKPARKSIDFYDGPKSIFKVAELVPVDFSGVGDLSILKAFQFSVYYFIINNILYSILNG